MGKQETYFAQRDRMELDRVLQDIESGKITLRNGQDEYVASLRKRIAKIDGKVGTSVQPQGKGSGENTKQNQSGSA